MTERQDRVAAQAVFTVHLIRYGLRKRNVADDYAIPLEQLGPCDYATKPENGDLIFFNARKLHAVLPGEGTDRLTISGFIGYRGDKEPLTVWS